MAKPTRLKDLPAKRMQQARDRELEQGNPVRVRNDCGCMVPAKDRYWVSPPMPLLQTSNQGKDSKIVLRTVQCVKCMRVLGGRTETEPMIHLAR